MKPNESAISLQIEWIKDCLRRGEQRKDIVQRFTTLYKTSIKTFDNRLKIAQKDVVSEQQRIKDKAEAGVVEKSKKLQLKIMTVEQRKDLLTKIATGQIKIPATENRWDAKRQKFVVLPKIELPSHQARISALAELNKMEGTYAPIKSVISIEKAGMEALEEIMAHESTAVKS